MKTNVIYLSVGPVFIISVFFTFTLEARASDDFKDVEIVKYKSIFVDKPPGTVAFLPRLGRSEYYNRVNEFHILPVSGLYRLPARGFYFFEVNKRMEQGQVSFLVAAFYGIYKKGESPKTPIYLNRADAAWKGGKYDDGSVRALSYDGEARLNINYDVLWEKHKESDLKTVDELMQRVWHAWPTEQGTGSWDVRRDLEKGPPPEFQSLITACHLKKEEVDVALTLLLMRFETSGAMESQKPLVFNFNGDNAVGAYMHLRSPSLFDFTRDYYFVFER
jgi:hypothetical protein